jgi:hypothetical protein
MDGGSSERTKFTFSSSSTGSTTLGGFWRTKFTLRGTIVTYTGLQIHLNS